MKIRIKFTKTGVMKFIGHLDMMRYFQKAVRRAEIDIAYTEGFSPHQKMSFAAPLGVGITSEGEYFDIEVNSTLSSREAMDALNKTMVDGVTITEYKMLPDQAKPAMSVVSAADYFIYPKRDMDETVFSGIEEYISQDTIVITKKTKKNEVELNLKEFIYDFKVMERDNIKGVFLRLSSGSTANIKPELVLQSYFQYMGLDYVPADYQEHRIEVYTGEPGNFISLGEMGENIE